MSQKQDAATGPRHFLAGRSRVGFSSRSGQKIWTVDQNNLRLTCLRHYDFAPEDVVAIERDGPAWLHAGVRIVHTRADYPARISFSCWGGSARVFTLLHDAGFVPSGTGPVHRPHRQNLVRFAVIALVLCIIVSGICQGLLQAWAQR